MNFATIVFGSIAFLIRHHINEDRNNHLKESVFTYTNEQFSLPRVDTYDFIIVGGGTAGCAVANRLSENPDFNVLLLEIGGKPPPQMEVPGFMKEFLGLPEVAFQYNSEFQRNSKTKNVVVRTGKVFGGTSSINAMFFNRGHPRDFDNWASITGDDSWSYANVLQYFIKSETYYGDFPFSDQHGATGPIPVSPQKYAPGLSVWLEAGSELGYPNVDPNGPQQISMGPIEFSKINGRRVNSYDAYIRPIEGKRTNLKIVPYADVDEIVLENGRAIGVTYKQHDISHLVKSSKEIILSAGAIGTPMLLLKSGIGPADELEAVGIRSKVNLPVGKNLKEHALVPLRIIINDTSHVYQIDRDMTEDAVKLYLEQGVGPLSTDKSLSAQGFAATSLSEHNDWPDIQFSLYSQDFPHLGVPVDDPINPNETGIFILPYLGRPKSAGSIRLDSDHQPVIDFRILSNPVDVRVYIEGIRKSLEIFENTEAYKRVGARYCTKPLEVCAELEFRSDAYWACYLKELVFIGNHESGTCRMGSQNDLKSVVDPKLRVHGVDGLRIVDASIFPEIVNANIQATIYMIAEKISTEILNYWTKFTNSANNVSGFTTGSASE